MFAPFVRVSRVRIGNGRETSVDLPPLRKGGRIVSGRTLGGVRPAVAFGADPSAGGWSR
jgi:hypothetical protein